MRFKVSSIKERLRGNFLSENIPNYNCFNSATNVHTVRYTKNAEDIGLLLHISKKSTLEDTINYKWNTMDSNNFLFEVDSSTSYQIGKNAQPMTLSKTASWNSMKITHCLNWRTNWTMGEMRSETIESMHSVLYITTT